MFIPRTNNQCQNVDIMATKCGETINKMNSEEENTSFMKSFEVFASNTYLQQRIIQGDNTQRKNTNAETIRKNKLREKSTKFNTHIDLLDIYKQSNDTFISKCYVFDSTANDNSVVGSICTGYALLPTSDNENKLSDNKQITEPSNGLNELHSSKKDGEIKTVASFSSKASNVQKSKKRPVLICEICSKTFTWKDSLLAHMAVHTGVYPYNCDVCGKKFALQPRLQLHVETMHSDKSYTCDRCAKSFAKVRHLRRHLKVHEEFKSYSCKICNKTFVVLSYLKGHIRIHLRDKPYMHDTTIIDCKGIEKPSYSAELLNSFVIKNFVDDEVKKTTAKLRKSPGKRKTSGNIKYSCIDCGKYFSRTWEYREHQRKHADEKEFKCDICGKCFKYQQGMICHKRLHNKEPTHKCQICNKGFYQMSNYKRHVMMHSGERPHVCQKCGKGFVIKPLLIRHSKSCQRRAFVCDHCNKAFTKHNRLESHMREHGFKYSCEGCRKSFETDIKLRKHKCKKSVNNLKDFCLQEVSIKNEQMEKPARKRLQKCEGSQIFDDYSLDYLFENVEIKHEIKEDNDISNDSFCEIKDKKELSQITNFPYEKTHSNGIGSFPKTDNFDTNIENSNVNTNKIMKIFKECVTPPLLGQYSKKIKRKEYSKNINQKSTKKTILRQQTFIMKYNEPLKTKRFENEHQKHTENIANENDGDKSELVSTKKHVHVLKTKNKTNAKMQNTKSKSKRQFNKKDNFPEGTRYKCDLCESTFVQKWSLIPHLRAHTHPYSFVCELCGKGFAYQTNLRDHRRMHLNIRPYKCKLCDKAFYQIGNLRSHELNHNRTVAHICEICGKEFVRKAHLRLHILRHEGYRPYVCSLCPKTFGCEKSYLRHMQLGDHIVVMDEMNNQTKIKLNCALQGSENDNNGSKFAEEQIIKSETQLRDIQEWDKQFSFTNIDKAALLQPVIQNEIEDGRARRRILKGRFVCEKCNKRFITAEQLKIHVSAHQSVEKQFANDSYDNINELSKFQCHVCFRFYLNEIRFKKHFKLKHESDPGVFCNECNKHFEYKEVYNGHLLVHSGRKVSVCTVCERVFANPSRLKEHQILHNIGQHFRCKICHETFRVKRSLNNHVKKVHLDSTFVIHKIIK